MPVLFDKPTFTLRLSGETINYANVENTLTIDHRGRSYQKTVEVPALLFTVMRRLSVPVDQPITMYLEEYGRKMVFGIALTGTDQFLDLWFYTFDQLPKGMLTVD